MPSRISILSALFAVGVVASLATFANELEPIARNHDLGAAGATAEVWSSRTVAVGIEVDRNHASLIAFTYKDRPLVRPAAGPAAKRGYLDGEAVQFEVVLRGPGGLAYTERIDVGPLCLLHDATAAPHIAGDTIRVHRDSFIVELPALEDFDTVEIAYYDSGKAATNRRIVGRHGLDPNLQMVLESPTDVTSSGSRTGPSDDSLAKAGSGTVRWPEQFGDSDIYRVYGAAFEASQRINVTIVPDGYTYSQKALMEFHADRLVAAFRGKSPYRELDPFINYTLVYAYSVESGTDQCDCGSTVNTAMGTRFPDSGDACGGSGNRCLYYGGSCDSGSTQNIVEAELRAPAHDETIIMVNTIRYGGCGGARAVFSAGNSSAAEIAIHELGHSIAGLADEYGGSQACGSAGSAVNTSTNATVGNWAEWIDEIGAPREGARYYENCVYRPSANCEMRALYESFCRVCSQHWALVTFGHPRVAPTAPIRSMAPGDSTATFQGLEATFSVDLRLPTRGTHTIEWFVEGPTDIEPVAVLEGAATLTHVFLEKGFHRVSVTVTAATDLIRPERFGANRDTAVVEVDVLALSVPPEISSAMGTPVGFVDAVTLVWEDAAFAGVTGYNLYRGTAEAVRLGDMGACLESGLTTNQATDLDIPVPGSAWTYLVTGTNPLGEGPTGLGTTSRRKVSSPCP